MYCPGTEPSALWWWAAFTLLCVWNSIRPSELMWYLRWLIRLWFSGLWCHVACYIGTGLSEECAPTASRVDADPEAGRILFLQNVGVCLQDYTVDYVNWFVFPPFCVWDLVSLLRSLFCCYFVPSGKFRDNAFKWSVAISTFFALHHSWSFISWYPTNCSYESNTHTAMFSILEFHLWGQPFVHENWILKLLHFKRKLKRTSEEHLAVSLCFNCFKLWQAAFKISSHLNEINGKNDICIHNGSSPSGDRVGNECVSPWHLEIGSCNCQVNLLHGCDLQHAWIVLTVGFEVITAVTVESAISFGVKLCHLVKMHCLHLQGHWLSQSSNQQEAWLTADSGCFLLVG